LLGSLSFREREVGEGVIDWKGRILQRPGMVQSPSNCPTLGINSVSNSH